MRSRRFWAITLWLLFLAFCITLVSRIHLGADISAFLPSKPTPAQQLLTEQLRDGVVSRLILIGIEGGSPEALARASKSLAGQLRQEPGFTLVSNGDEESLVKDRAFLFENRYLLSPAVTPERFTAGSLHSSLENSLQMFGSPLGIMLKQVVPHDPTGELLHLLEDSAGQGPSTVQGVWMSPDERRALLLLQTAAPGYDIGAQAQIVSVTRSRFFEITRSAELSGLKLLLSGPAVFSVEARDHIEGVATRFSVLTAILVSVLLLLFYRSWRVLVLSLLPVLSGVLAGLAAVSLEYGVVFGITLGFGITLIGEAVDYAIYFFTRLSPVHSPRTALLSLWPALRLGVLTTICGFSPMFLADFPGLAQLGVFSIAGLIAAVLVARWVLPEVVPVNFSTVAPLLLSRRLMHLVKLAPRLRAIAAVVVVVAGLSIVLRHGPVWSDTLSSLSPLPPSELRLDESLRRDLGAPDARYMVIVSGQEREAVLQRCEEVGNALTDLISKGQLARYDSPARYLPSEKAQRARLAALPPPEVARSNLQQALVGLPFRKEIFAPFLEDIEAGRRRGPLTLSDMKGTSIGLQIESLLLHRSDTWLALMPLRGVTDAAVVSHALEQEGERVALLDMKQESDHLYQTYVDEAVTLSALGAAAIVLLLFGTLRSAVRVARVLIPLGAAVIVTAGIILATGEKLLIFHLVGLLLAVAVGSNYTLFFEQETTVHEDSQARSRTMVSLLVANLSTTIAFGMLAFSGVPVLTAIGETVAMGAFLSLLFSAVLMGDKIGH